MGRPFVLILPKISQWSLEGTDAVVEGLQRETAAKAIEATSSFGNALTF